MWLKIGKAGFYQIAVYTCEDQDASRLCKKAKIVKGFIINNQSEIPSTDVIQLTLSLKMTTAQVVEASVTVNNNRPIQDYVHSDDQTQPTFD